MTVSKPRPDYLAIGIALASFVVQVFIGVFWFGGLSKGVTDLERRQAATEAAQLATNNTVSDQKAQLAGLTSKLDGIKGVVDTVNGKLDAKPNR